jgi:uncharacterized coiled-coil protein SlyX
LPDTVAGFGKILLARKLNPDCRATNSIALRFDTISKTLETLILSQLEVSQERQTAVLKKLSEQFGNHANVINSQSKQINALYQIHQRDYKKLFHLIQLYSELSACGVMDSKRKENLRAEIINLINT